MAANATITIEPNIEPGSESRSASPKRANHFPSLDGLRALSIIFVLVGHLSGTRGAGTLDFGIGDYARLGVVVFFVISGFLITSLLLSEHARKGRVSLKRFYIRRALRIFPPSYAYLAVICVLWFAGIQQFALRDFWHAATYTVNFEPNSSWRVGHLWSLSVEEQFYLLWPFAFVFLGSRRAVWAALIVVALAPVARAGNRMFLWGTPYSDLPMFPMVADSLAMGCLLAMTRGWLEVQGWYLRLFRPVYSLLLLAAVLLISRYSGYTVIAVLGTSVLNVCLAILLHRSVYNPHDWAGKALNWRPLATIGVLSYSLYLWQQLFLNRHSSAWINAFPQNILFAVAAALGSYFLLERSVLRLRDRWRA